MQTAEYFHKQLHQVTHGDRGWAHFFQLGSADVTRRSISQPPGRAGPCIQMAHGGLVMEEEGVVVGSCSGGAWDWDNSSG